MRKNKGKDGLLQWRSQVCRASPILCTLIAHTEIWSATLCGWQKGEPTSWIMCLILKVASLWLCVLSCVHLFWDPMDWSPPCSSVHGIFQASWSGLPCPPPGDFPDPEIKPSFLVSPALAGRFFAQAPPGVSLCVGCVCACTCAPLYLTLWRPHGL